MYPPSTIFFGQQDNPPSTSKTVVAAKTHAKDKLSENLNWIQVAVLSEVAKEAP